MATFEITKKSSITSRYFVITTLQPLEAIAHVRQNKAVCFDSLEKGEILSLSLVNIYTQEKTNCAFEKTSQSLWGETYNAPRFLHPFLLVERSSVYYRSYFVEASTSEEAQRLFEGRKGRGFLIQEQQKPVHTYRVYYTEAHGLIVGMEEGEQPDIHDCLYHGSGMRIMDFILFCQNIFFAFFCIMKGDNFQKEKERKWNSTPFNLQKIGRNIGRRQKHTSLGTCQTQE